MAACSLLIAETIEQKADPSTELYVSLVFTATLFAGILQMLLGVLRYIYFNSATLDQFFFFLQLFCSRIEYNNLKNLNFSIKML